MLMFFRRIRQRLFSLGQVQRYLIYAVGEIVLVVVGILIALQINNWNEWRKERALERIVLEDIESNINRNLLLINSAISTIENINLSTEVLINVIEDKIPYSDSLSLHLDQGMRSGTFLFKLNSDGYESLQSTGFNIIQNEELKDEILSLYEVTYGYVLTTLQFANSIYDYHAWKDFFYKNSDNLLVPYSQNTLLDKRLFTEIMDIKFLRNDFRNALEESLEPSQKVLHLIESELDKFLR